MKGRARYLAPRSATKEQFFWEGSKAKSPRTFTLWLEPIITVAGMARLHFDYGWPRHLIGAQSGDWAFDLVTYMPDRQGEYLAAEVKKTRTELDHMLNLMRDYGREPGLSEPPPSGRQRNAYKKVIALRARRAPLFWALGPDGYDRVFRIRFRTDEMFEMEAAPSTALLFPH